MGVSRPKWKGGYMALGLDEKVDFRIDKETLDKLKRIVEERGYETVSYLIRSILRREVSLDDIANRKS